MLIKFLLESLIRKAERDFWRVRMKIVQLHFWGL